MEKRNVEIEDFLQDEEFILWIKKPSVDRDKYWKAWMEANPEHVSTLLKARELLLSINFKSKLPEKNEREEILRRIVKKLDDKYDMYLPRKQRYTSRWVAIAASLAFLISVGFYLTYHLQNKPAQHEVADEATSVTIKETPPGIKLQTVLPDGSKVWLNADSKISYDQSYGKEERAVLLTGEAFFEVEKDEARPFIVQSGSLKITALGTSFNVKSLIESPAQEVALVTGKVEVVNEGNQADKVILNPGQRVIHKSAQAKLQTLDFSLENVLGWKNGVIVFDNACFYDIQKTLERWYGVTIHSELSKAEWSYTGKFDNQSLELVLKRLAFIKGFRFRIDGKKVYLFN